jgi:hypothetical protein
MTEEQLTHIRARADMWPLDRLQAGAGEGLSAFDIALLWDRQHLLAHVDVLRAEIERLRAPPPKSGPSRAFRLVLAIEADSRDDLARGLCSFADSVDRDEVTRGVSGGYSSGYIYELLVDPNQTHDSYFAKLDAHLAHKRANGT